MLVFNHAMGTHLSVGTRKAPTPDQVSKLKKLNTYGSLPVTPINIDYYTKAQLPLSQMYMNDQLGCCVEACIAHLEGVFTINSGRPAAIYSNTGIVQMYSQMGGYVPGNPLTDLGTFELVALLDWMSAKPPHRIAGYLSIDPSEVRQAIYLFENVVFGLELATEWFPNVQPGFVWDGRCHVNPLWGHCVAGVGTNKDGIVISTWGMTGTLTDRAIADVIQPQYNGQLYCVLSAEIVDRAKQKAPNNLDWKQLETDFPLIGSQI